MSYFYALGISLLYVVVVQTGSLAFFSKGESPLNSNASSSTALATAIAMLYLISNPIQPYKFFQDTWRKTMYDLALIPSQINDLRSKIAATPFDMGRIPASVRIANFGPLSQASFTAIEQGATPALYDRMRLAAMIVGIGKVEASLRSTAFGLALFDEKREALGEYLRSLSAMIREKEIAENIRTAPDIEVSLISGEGLYEERLSDYAHRLAQVLFEAELLLACAIATRTENADERAAFVAAGFQVTPNVANTIRNPWASWTAIAFLLALIASLPFVVFPLRYPQLLPALAHIQWPLQEFSDTNTFTAVHYTLVPLAIALYATFKAASIHEDGYRGWLARVLPRAMISAYLSILIVRAAQILIFTPVEFDLHASCGTIAQGQGFPVHCILFGALWSQVMNTFAVVLTCVAFVVLLVKLMIDRVEVSSFRFQVAAFLAILVLASFNFMAKLMIGQLHPEDLGWTIIVSFGYVVFLYTFFSCMIYNYRTNTL